MRKKKFTTVHNLFFFYHTEGNRVVKCEESDYSCQHEEADTLIMFHVFKAAANSKI